jgi:tetrahydromethanopterin S-methyltransferase subunit G
MNEERFTAIEDRLDKIEALVSGFKAKAEALAASPAGRKIALMLGLRP